MLEQCNDQLRDPKEIAIRAIILDVLVSVAHKNDSRELISWLKRENLWEKVTEKEKLFLTASEPTKNDYIKATWRIESLNILLWSIGKLKSAGSTASLCDTQAIQDMSDSYYLRSTKEFIKNAKLIDRELILSQKEVIYQLHWEVRDARIKGIAPSDKHNPGVVQERHYALNWLIGYMDQEWDDITTDT
jgi:hypothetical protein